jgi:cytochrome P450
MSVPLAPGRLPVVGHLHRLVRDPVGAMQRMREVGDVVRFDVGTLPVYLVNSPELLHQMLVTDTGSFVRGLAYERTRPILGDGLATISGELHLRRRRMMLPSFHRNRLLGYLAVMRDQAEALTARWEDGATIAMDRALRRASAAGALRALFRTDLDDATVADIDACVAAFLDQVPGRALQPRWMERLPTPGNREFQRVAAKLRRIVEEMIEERRHDPRERTDLLSMLLAARDETGGALPPAALRDELITMLAGGSDTVPTTLSWLYHELGRHPEIQARLQQELDGVLGGRPVDFDDLPKLTYTRRVIDETLRRHSVAWMMSRRAARPVTLGPYRIPAGAELLFSPATLHRDPALYPEPLRFDPDRWARPPARQEFIPFGAGSRKCIGDHFSYLQMTVIVAAVSARWQVRPAPGSRVRERTAGVLRPNALPMIVQSRGAAASAAPASTAARTTANGV